MRTQGDRLVNELHERLIQSGARRHRSSGPTWQQLFAPPGKRRGHDTDLVALAACGAARTCRAARLRLCLRSGRVAARARALRGVTAVDRVLYSMKANPNAQILRVLAAEGLAFECVSRGEIEHLLACVPGLDRGAHPFYAELRRTR